VYCGLCVKSSERPSKKGARGPGSGCSLTRLEKTERFAADVRKDIGPEMSRGPRKNSVIHGTYRTPCANTSNRAGGVVFLKDGPGGGPPARGVGCLGEVANHRGARP